MDVKYLVQESLNVNMNAQINVEIASTNYFMENVTRIVVDLISATMNVMINVVKFVHLAKNNANRNVHIQNVHSLVEKFVTHVQKNAKTNANIFNVQIYALKFVIESHAMNHVIKN